MAKHQYFLAIIITIFLITANLDAQGQHVDVSFDAAIEFGEVTDFAPPPVSITAINFEYGVRIGINIQIDKKQSFGMGIGGMTGGFSLAYFSYIDLQVYYLFGDKIDSFAFGPLIGSNWYGVMAGCACFYKNLFINPAIIWDYYFNRINLICSIGYSFPLSIIINL